MSGTATPDRDKLLKLLSEQLELCENLHELCKEQTGLLADDELEKLDKNLTKAQALRDKINGLHQESKPLMQSCVSKASGAEDAEINEISGKIRAMLEKSAKINEKNMGVLKQIQGEQKKKINEQSAKRKGIGGYAQAVATNSEVFDKKT